MNPFEQITNLTDRRRAFLEEMCQHYNSTNRAEALSGCVYEPTATSAGCAIGRWCPETYYELGTVHASCIYRVLPKWMLDMGIAFLRECQLMHDGAKNWTSTGLSDDGQINKRSIYIKYCCENLKKTNAG